MPLSEEERKRLRELEEELTAEDPDLARRGRRGRSDRTGARKVYGLLIIAAGFPLLIAGIRTDLTVLGILGFLAAGAGAYLISSGPGESRSPGSRCRSAIIRPYRPGSGQRLISSAHSGPAGRSTALCPPWGWEEVVVGSGARRASPMLTAFGRLAADPSRADEHQIPWRTLCSPPFWAALIGSTVQAESSIAPWSPARTGSTAALQ
jgi:hypothetical protein